MRYHLIPIRIAATKRKCVGKDVEKLEPLYAVGGNVKWFNRYEKHIWRFLNIQNRISVWSSNPTSEYTATEVKAAYQEISAHPRPL